MIYSFCLFFICSIYFITKEFNYKHSRWLFVILISFCVSIIGLILYSVYFWDYYYLRNIIFDITKPITLFIYSLNLSTYTVSRILTISSAIFYYAIVNFSLSYSNTMIKSKCFHFLIAFLPLQYIVLYDPYIQNELFSFVTNNLDLNFHPILNAFNLINKCWFSIYIIFSIGLLYKMYKSLTNRYIKQKVFSISLGVFTLILQYILIFYWMPTPLILLRGNLPEYVNNYAYSSYINLNFYPSIILYYIYTFTGITSTLLFLYSIFTYNAFELVSIHTSLKNNKMISFQNLSSAISHVVKNKICELKVVSQTNEEDDLDTLKDKLLSVNTLCDQLLYRLDTMNSKNGVISFNYSVFNIDAIYLKEVIDHLNIPTHIRVTILPSSNILKCYIDVMQIHEVLINLLNNALEAMKDTPGEITIVLFSERGYNVISITDSGPGISPQNLKLIFNPFYSTKPSHTNWGIGLSYCTKVIKSHKGKITVESKLGQSTTFNVLLPTVTSLYKS